MSLSKFFKNAAKRAEKIARAEKLVGGPPMEIVPRVTGLPIAVWHELEGSDGVEIYIHPRPVNQAVTKIQLRKWGVFTQTELTDRDILMSRDPGTELIRIVEAGIAVLEKLVEAEAEQAAKNGDFFDEDDEDSVTPEARGARVTALDRIEQIRKKLGLPLEERVKYLFEQELQAPEDDDKIPF